jgi:hypothetical protein
MLLLFASVLAVTATDTGTAVGAAATGLAALVAALWVIAKSFLQQRRVDRERMQSMRDELAQLRAERREWERDRVEWDRERERKDHKIDELQQRRWPDGPSRRR